MTYVFKEKFQLADLANVSRVAKCVVLLETDSILRDIYKTEFGLLGLDSVFCENQFEVDSVVKRHNPHLFICNTDIFKNESELIELLKYIKKIYHYLPLLTYSLRTSPDLLSKLLNCGVSSHLDRKFSRPRDLLDIVRAVLNS